MSEKLFALLKQLEDDPAYPNSHAYLTDGVEEDLPPLIREIISELEDGLVMGVDGFYLKNRVGLIANGYYVLRGDCPAIVTCKGKIAVG